MGMPSRPAPGNRFRRGVVQVPQGSLYPALHRLETADFSPRIGRKTESGREAKFYRLTRERRTQLETEAASWQRLIEAVGLVLQNCLAEVRNELVASSLAPKERWKNILRRIAVPP